MKNLPIFTSVTDKPVLVIGGGDVGLRKIETLLKAKALVTVVSHEFCKEVSSIKDDRLTLIKGEYEKQQIDDKWLVIAATDDNSLNQRVHDDAVASKTFVNVVDDPANCEFIFAAIIDRSPIVMAISSGGDAPVLARLWKEKLETLLPQWTGQLASLAGSYRDRVKKQITDFTSRRQFWERLFRGDIAASASQGNWDEVERKIEQTLAADNHIAGSVFYVNAGDGDPENLTLKALQAMQLADKIYYPENFPPALIDLCRKDSTKQTLHPDSIAEQIQTDASNGEIICRLYLGPEANEHGLKEEAQRLNSTVTWVRGLS